jgi:hypothetical protein
VLTDAHRYRLRDARADPGRRCQGSWVVAYWILHLGREPGRRPGVQAKMPSPDDQCHACWSPAAVCAELNNQCLQRLAQQRHAQREDYAQLPPRLLERN